MKSIRVIKAKETDFEHIEIAYFKEVEKAQEFCTQLNKYLNMVILEYDKNLYSVALIFKTEIYFSKFN